jgi:hypothetical protein
MVLNDAYWVLKGFAIMRLGVEVRSVCRVIGIALAINAVISTTGLADDKWPELEKPSTDFVCLETLKQARSAFLSSNFHLYEIAPVAPEAQSEIILQSTGIDISGGDGAYTKAGEFEDLPLNIPGQSPSTVDYYHWQLRDTAGWRFVIVSENVGWRGNFYTLYRINTKLTQDQFLTALGNKVKKTLPSPVIVQNWRPPMVFQRKDNGAAWAVDVGQTFTILTQWRVFSANGLRMEPTCKIKFSPKFKQSKDLLPKPLGDLIENLFAATGTDGPNSGTLLPVSKTRIDAEYMWANVATRPWAALAAKPYNTKERADSGLKEWARTAKNEKTYSEIVAQYPKAERALANYYEKTFGKSTGEAAEMAHAILDLAFRSHFVFSADN